MDPVSCRTPDRLPDRQVYADSGVCRCPIIVFLSFLKGDAKAASSGYITTEVTIIMEKLLTKVGCTLGKENCYYLAETVKTEQEIGRASAMSDEADR